MKLAIFEVDEVLSNNGAVWPEGRSLVWKLFTDGWAITYISHRPDSEREAVLAWLHDHVFPSVHESTIDMIHSDGRHTRPEATVLYVAAHIPVFEDVTLMESCELTSKLVEDTLGYEHVYLCDWSRKQSAHANVR